MPTRNINLTDHYDTFVEESVSAGQFANASEVIRAGLRLLEQSEAERALRLDRLRAEVRKGIAAADRGDAVTLEPGDVTPFLAKAGRRAARRAKHGQG